MSNIAQSSRSTYLKSVLHNGIGRYVCQLQRITFRFSKTRVNCLGVREYIEKDLMDFAKANPGVVIYLKPRRVGLPSIVAEYLNGNSHYKPLPCYTREEVFKWVDFARTQSGFPISRIIKNIHTDTPSIQGVWNPFTYKPSYLNVTEFPNEELSKAKTFFPSATEQLLEIAKSSINSEEVTESENPVKNASNIS